MSDRASYDLCRILKNEGILETQAEIDEALAFLRKCLRLDPKERLPAEQLMVDPWLISI